MRRGTLLYFLLSFALLSKAQISIPSVNLPVTQVFSVLAPSGTNSIMPAGWVFLETGTGSNTTYTGNTGTFTTNDTYSYGIDNFTTERALGELTDIITTKFGASFTNNTGVSITNLMIQYAGEQWRLGATG